MKNLTSRAHFVFTLLVGLLLLAVSPIVGGETGAAATTDAAEGGWIKDSVTDCAAWSIKKPRPDEGVSWSGACVDGKASGRGVLIWWDQKGLVARYTGEMSAGKLNGEGRLFLRADDAKGYHEYLGRFDDSKPVGTGFVRTAKGAKFIGEVIDGIRHGKGVLLTTEGWLIKGEIKDGKGVGTLVVDYTTDEGERYIGQVKNGKRNGFGILTASDKDFYAGGFSDGKPNGPGIYKGVKGDRYSGDFAGGKPNGFGTSIDPDGNVVQGRFVNGDPEGTVLVTKADGTQTVTKSKSKGAK